MVVMLSPCRSPALGGTILSRPGGRSYRRDFGRGGETMMRPLTMRSCQYTPYSLAASTMAFTFSALASSKNAPLLTINPPPLPAVSMIFFT